MKIIIDIPEKDYEFLKNKQVFDNIAESIIANGTPLPKEHGRLTDLDEIIRFTYATYGIGSGKSITEDNKDFIDYIYNEAPVLVE